MAEVLKSPFAYNFGGAEVLEFCGVCPSFGTKTNEQLRTLQVTVVVRGNIRDEICWEVLPDYPVPQSDGAHAAAPLTKLFHCCASPLSHSSRNRRRPESMPGMARPSAA